MKAPKRKNLVQEYMNEIINYGGIPTPRWEVIQHMQSIGGTQQMIDRWFQGYEYSRRKSA